MSSVKPGVPGHCYALDGSALHAAGGCEERDCDKGCCAPVQVTQLAEIITKRNLMLTKVSEIFQEHPEYKTVVFHREVIGNSEIMTAVFLDGWDQEAAQHIVDYD